MDKTADNEPPAAMPGNVNDLIHESKEIIIMNTKNYAAVATVALALVGASVTAFAADTGLTREQVRAELARARADGTLLPNSESYGYNNASIALPQSKAAVTAQAGKSRDEVRAELARARAEGTLVPNSESYSTNAPVIASTRTRAEVRAEAIAAAKEHKTDASYGAVSTGY